MLKGFDPVRDALDRRLLYEVTGLELVEDEFKGEDSSDSEADEPTHRQAKVVVPLMLNPDSGDESSDGSEQQEPT